MSSSCVGRQWAYCQLVLPWLAVALAEAMTDLLGLVTVMHSPLLLVMGAVEPTALSTKDEP